MHRKYGLQCYILLNKGNNQRLVYKIKKICKNFFLYNYKESQKYQIKEN